MNMRAGARRIAVVGDADIANDRVLTGRREFERVGSISEGGSAGRIGSDDRAEAGGHEKSREKPRKSVEISHNTVKLGFVERLITQANQNAHRFLKKELFRKKLVPINSQLHCHLMNSILL